MVLARRSLALCVAVALATVSSVARAEALPEPTLTPAESGQLRQLQLRLDDIDLERAGTSTVLPWTVVALGVGAMLVGGTLGLARVASCEDSCTSPFWPTWVLVGGAGVSTAGLIWLKLVHEDLAELQSRRYHVQTQIDAYELIQKARSEHALIQVRGTF